MIAMKELLDLALAMPKCRVEKPIDGVSWIYDTKGDRVAHILWETSEIMLHAEYEHIDAVIESIGADKVTIVKTMSTDDLTEALYGEPE